MHICPTTFLAVLPLILSSISWSADAAKGQEAYNSGDYQTALTEWQPVCSELVLKPRQAGQIPGTL